MITVVVCCNHKIMQLSLSNAFQDKVLHIYWKNTVFNDLQVIFESLSLNLTPAIQYLHCTLTTQQACCQHKKYSTRHKCLIIMSLNKRMILILLLSGTEASFLQKKKKNSKERKGPFPTESLLQTWRLWFDIGFPKTQLTTGLTSSVLNML